MNYVFNLFTLHYIHLNNIYLIYRLFEMSLNAPKEKFWHIYITSGDKLVPKLACECVFVCVRERDSDQEGVKIDFTLKKSKHR